MLTACTKAVMRRCSLLLLLIVLLIALHLPSFALSQQADDLGAELDTELAERPKPPQPRIPSPPPPSHPSPVVFPPSAAPSRFTPRTIVRDAPAAEPTDEDPTSVRGRGSRGSKGQQPPRRQPGAGGGKREVADPGMIDWIPSPPSVSAGKPWKSRVVSMDELRRAGRPETEQPKPTPPWSTTPELSEPAQQPRPRLSVDPQLPVTESAVVEPPAPKHSAQVKAKALPAVPDVDDEEDLDQALSSRRPGSVRAAPAKPHSHPNAQPSPPAPAEPPAEPSADSPPPAEPAVAATPPAAPAEKGDVGKGEDAAEATKEADAAVDADAVGQPMPAAVLAPSQPEPTPSAPSSPPSALPAEPAASTEPPAAPAEQKEEVKGEEPAAAEAEAAAPAEAQQASEPMAGGVLPPSEPEPRRTKPSFTPAEASATSEPLPPLATAEEKAEAPAAATTEAKPEGDAAAPAEEAEELQSAKSAPDAAVKEAEPVAATPVASSEEPQPAAPPPVEGRGGGGPLAAGGGGLYSAQKPVRAAALLDTPLQPLSTPPVKGVRNLHVPGIPPAAAAADQLPSVAAAALPAETETPPAAAAEVAETSSASASSQQEEETLPLDEVRDESAPQEEVDARAAETPQDLHTPGEEPPLQQPTEPEAGDAPVANAAAKEDEPAAAAGTEQSSSAAYREAGRRHRQSPTDMGGRARARSSRQRRGGASGQSSSHRGRARAGQSPARASSQRRGGRRCGQRAALPAPRSSCRSRAASAVSFRSRQADCC